MLGPKGMITISDSFEQGFTAACENFELVTAQAYTVDLDRLAKMVAAIALDSNESTSTGSFQSVDDTKHMEIDPIDPSKIVCVGSQLSNK